MDEIEAIGVAEEQIVEQKQVSVEQTIKATLIADLHEQLAGMKQTVHMDEQLDQEQEAGDLDVRAEAYADAEHVDVVNDLIQLCTHVDGISEAARQCIDQLRETDRFFSENALEEMRSRLPRDMQQQAAAAAEQTLVREFAVNKETTIDQVSATRQTWQQEYDDVSRRLYENPPAEEQYTLERQSVELCKSIDHYETLERVAALAGYNEQCAEAQKLLEQMKLAPPVLLDAEGAPVQRFGRRDIGPAFASQENAEKAAEDEHQRRLAEKPDATWPHVLKVEIRDADEKVIHRWWELSESGHTLQEGHSEQKAINRMNLDALKERDYHLSMEGPYPPCAQQAGCMNVLEWVYQQYGIRTEYHQTAGRDARYRFD
jgi:hypothetical protein